jgi:hypothetical protein
MEWWFAAGGAIVGASLVILVFALLGAAGE